MRRMSKKPGGEPQGAIWKIAIPVAVAFLSAGGAPWWGPLLWQKIFPVPYMGQLQWGTNLQGGDIANIEKADVNTAGECSTRCAQEERCEAMTFVMHASGNGGICWLKDAVPPTSPNPAMVSAVKVFP